MDKIFPADRFDLALNLSSGLAFIFTIGAFQEVRAFAQLITDLLSITNANETYVVLAVWVICAYVAGYVVTVFYHAIFTRVNDMTIPTRVRYVLFGVGLDPKFKLLIGGSALTQEERRVFIQKARSLFPSLPRAPDKITNEHCITIFRMAEHTVKNNESTCKHIQQTETRFAVAGRLAISIWAALSISVLITTCYTFIVASAPVIFVTATKALQTFPGEFSTLLKELADCISSLDNSNLSIMRLSFKSGAILLVTGFVTFIVLSFFRFYQMQYDGEIFRYVVYSDVGTKARKQPAQAE